MRTALLALALGALVATLVGANASATASRPAAPAAPVPSLEPVKTRALWQRLVEHPRHERLQGECQPLRGVFYAATDWLRLATKLAANASPCGRYYVSIPPVVSDKTKLRPDQARQIRALGENFHALAEIHWSAWGKWVATTGSTWYAAGVEARKRMVEAGFDIAAGDTWAVNEFPSTVRSGAGSARANARELVRGLFQSDGTRTARGVVFIVGIGQSTGNVSVYQANLQNWLADVAFWSDMSAYVSDWSQEVYPDYRRYAVPGADLAVRRDYLNDYLQHTLVVSRAGPQTIEPGRGFLAQALSPLAGAAWQYDSGYGWTNVPFDQMQAFVSGEVYALRSASVGCRRGAGPLGLRLAAEERQRAFGRRLRESRPGRSSTGWEPRSATRARATTRTLGAVRAGRRERTATASGICLERRSPSSGRRSAPGRSRC